MPPAAPTFKWRPANIRRMWPWPIWNRARRWTESSHSNNASRIGRRGLFWSINSASSPATPKLAAQTSTAKRLFFRLFFLVFPLETDSRKVTWRRRDVCANAADQRWSDVTPVRFCSIAPEAYAQEIEGCNFIYGCEEWPPRQPPPCQWPQIRQASYWHLGGWGGSIRVNTDERPTPASHRGLPFLDGRQRIALGIFSSL